MNIQLHRKKTWPAWLKYAEAQDGLIAIICLEAKSGGLTDTEWLALLALELFISRSQSAERDIALMKYKRIRTEKLCGYRPSSRWLRKFIRQRNTIRAKCALARLKSKTQP